MSYRDDFKSNGVEKNLITEQDPQFHWFTTSTKFENEQIFNPFKKLQTTEGIKESFGKLTYELDFEFIKAMAERMQSNKGKYPAYNWMKPMDLNKLLEAEKRHFFEVLCGNYEDDGDEFGHVVAGACNLMMIWRQLKNKENDTD